jgi:Trp operon repressor
MNDLDSKALIKEVRDLKMLLVLQLLNAEVKQRTIAQFLGVSEATVSRMLPPGASKRKGNKKAQPMAEETS